MEELIKKVRAKPVLYNTNHTDYMKKSLKDAIWQTIAEELNYANGDEVKTLWLKLRNCHRDALRRRESKNKSGSKRKPKTWKYDVQMSFLLKYMLNKPAIQNIINPGYHADERQSKEPIIKIEDEDRDSPTRETQSVTDNEYLYTENENDSTFEIWGPKQVMKKPRKNSSMGDMLAETNHHDERAKNAVRPQGSPDDGHDELYHFYMSMYGITKKFPLCRQLRLKRKIFDLVAEEQEHELKLLSQ